MMTGAIAPGNDISLVIQSEHICERCEWRSFPMAYRRVPEWCSQCNDDPLRDPQEDEFWNRTKSECFTLFGWRFSVNHPEQVPDSMGARIYVRLWKRLVNPEAPWLCLSMAYFAVPPNKDTHHFSYERDFNTGRPKACFWLIAHWWEHFLDICPCQHGEQDDVTGSHFRQVVIDALMWYHERGLS